MKLDCDSCVMREIACGDCVVTLLMSLPTADCVIDEAETAALDVLAAGGLVPALRLVAPLQHVAEPVRKIHRPAG